MNTTIVLHTPPLPETGIPQVVLTIEKSAAFGPVTFTGEVKSRVFGARFVSVTRVAALDMPSITLPNATVSGDTVTVGVIPAPVSAALIMDGLPFSAKFSEALSGPLLD